MLALLVSLTIVSVSAASEDPKNVTGNGGYGGYYVMPVKNNGMNEGLTASSIYYIMQGQINLHNKYISGPGFNVDLNWGNPTNSLRLRIFTPDGYTLGPFYDYSDGIPDGRINIYIGRDGGVAQGTYQSEVYGERVSGTEDYTFT